MENTIEDAKKALEKMHKASLDFYSAAVRTNCHAFIEFTGLMNEYIKVCSKMTAVGDTSWMMANTHSGVPLDMAEHELNYLAEKLDCIYDPTMAATPSFQPEGGLLQMVKAASWVKEAPYGDD